MKINMGSVSACDNTPWSEWGACDRACGTGVASRTRIFNGASRTENRKCNTQRCKFEDHEITDMQDCTCPNNGWWCDSADCANNETCQRVFPDANEMRCLPNVVGQCSAFGDPHVVTFDGAKNNVFGVGTYTMINHVGEAYSFEVQMDTDAVGRVSATNVVRFHYVDADNKVTITTTKHGQLTINAEKGNIHESWNISGTSFTTHFGLTLIHAGRSAHWKIPYVFSETISGICGNYNMDSSDDFVCPDGTAVGTAFEAAQCWMTSGDIGPDPPTIIESCRDKHLERCTQEFSAPWMAGCLELVTTEFFIDACVVDYCEETVDASIHAVIEEFINECQRHNPLEDAVCNWRNHLDIADCPAPTTWTGCGRSCDFYRECNTPANECFSPGPWAPRFMAGCFCPEGQFFNADRDSCMSYADCNPEWTEWSDCVNYERTRTKGSETETETCGEGCEKWPKKWGDCSVTCGKGTKTKTRACGNKEQGEYEETKTGSCDAGKCVVCVPDTDACLLEHKITMNSKNYMKCEKKWLKGLKKQSKGRRSADFLEKMMRKKGDCPWKNCHGETEFKAANKCVRSNKRVMKKINKN